jgi:replication factor C subunit 1
MEYVPYLRSHLLHPLTTKGSEGADEVMEVLDSYGFSRDDFMETMKEMQFTVAGDKDLLLSDQYEKLDSKVKAAFTRVYNSNNHSSQALVHSAEAPKKTRGGGGGDDDEQSGTVEDLDASKEDVEDEVYICIRKCMYIYIYI